MFLDDHLRLKMVNCVGCRKQLKNEKSYRNHKRHCKRYVKEGSQRLHLRRENLVKKALARAIAVEESQEHSQAASGDIPDIEIPIEVVVFHYLQ